jgi:hypothetical protein
VALMGDGRRGGGGGKREGREMAGSRDDDKWYLHDDMIYIHMIYI